MRAPEQRKARKVKLPLRVLEYHDGYCDIVDADGLAIDDDGLSRETADLVVTAVNAHDDLAKWEPPLSIPEAMAVLQRQQIAADRIAYLEAELKLSRARETAYAVALGKCEEELAVLAEKARVT